MSTICERKAPVARYKITDAETYRNTLTTKANKRFSAMELRQSQFAQSPDYGDSVVVVLVSYCF